MPSSRRRIVVLGSTGSIGTQTLDVVRQHPDRLEIVGLAVHGRLDSLAAQLQEFPASHVAVGDDDRFHGAAARSAEAFLRDVRDGDGYPLDVEVGFGSEAVTALTRLPEADVIVNALVGAAGLRASYEALAAGKVLALANKESLVVGGDLLMPMAAHGRLLPIDSEHGAIYQCLLGEKADDVERLWVTASGGPFRGLHRDDLVDVTPERALAHPTWKMGPKITVDSSTLMNKGLEVIEAHHLFGMPYGRIEVVVQPQSAVHSMVEFSDGSVKAHLGTTDMRIPIQFALSYPERWGSPVRPLDFRTLGSLDFLAPDTDAFRCLDLARQAGEAGGTLPCAMNAANEVAVSAFLAGECPFLGIAEVVERVMARTSVDEVTDLEQLEHVDGIAREEARKFLSHPGIGGFR